MDTVYQIAGAILVLLAMGDVFLTVLFARSNTGLIMPWVNRRVWLLFRVISKSGRFGKHRIAPFCGPTLIVLSVLVWTSLLVLGFSLIFYPALGMEVQASPGFTDFTFGEAFYFSAFNFTTLGVGDLHPTNNVYRFLAVVEAGLGFSIFTLTLTYLMSVYNAVNQRNAFALELNIQSGETGDAAVLIDRFQRQEGFSVSFQSIARDLLQVFEQHHAYPILHYFRYSDPTYAISRVLCICLDLVTLYPTLIEPKESGRMEVSASIDTLERSCDKMLFELLPHLLPRKWRSQLGKPTLLDEREAFRRRYHDAWAKLHSTGCPVVSNPQERVEEYIEKRCYWHSHLKLGWDYMGMQLDDVDPALARVTRQSEDLRQESQA